MLVITYAIKIFLWNSEKKTSEPNLIIQSWVLFYQHNTDSLNATKKNNYGCLLKIPLKTGDCVTLLLIEVVWLIDGDLLSNVARRDSMWVDSAITSCKTAQ